MKSSLIALLAAFGSLLIVSASAQAADESALAKAKLCTTCHAIDKKLVGPAYKDVAKKYAGDPKAEDMLVEKVIKGGKGVWGPTPMTPNKVTPEEAHRLVKWVLSLK